MNFIRLATNITITTENMRSLRDDALQALIEDRLKLQEANNVVPGAEIQAQNVAASFIEQNFGRDGMTAQEILSQENVNIETVLAKYTADVFMVKHLTYPVCTPVCIAGQERRKRTAENKTVFL